MTDNRESKFYTYNVDNIMKNLIAGEVHARDLDENREKGHDSCLRKHLLMTENELEELQSHTLQVNPENKKSFDKLKKKTEKLRHNLNEMSTEKIINEIRSIRKDMESFNEEYDTSRCSACKAVGDVLSAVNEKTSSSERSESNPGEKQETLGEKKEEPQFPLLKKIQRERPKIFENIGEAKDTTETKKEKETKQKGLRNGFISFKKEKTLGEFGESTE